MTVMAIVDGKTYTGAERWVGGQGKYATWLIRTTAGENVTARRDEILDNTLLEFIAEHPSATWKRVKCGAIWTTEIWHGCAGCVVSRKIDRLYAETHLKETA